MIKQALNRLDNFHLRNNFALILAVYFLVLGVKKIIQAGYSEYYMMFLNEDFSNTNFPTDLNFSDVLTNPILYSFYLGLIIVVGVIHWILKINRINYIFVLVISMVLFPVGAYTNEGLSSMVSSFCYLFSDDMKIAFYAGGIVLLVHGLSLLFIVLRKYTLDEDGGLAP